MWVGKPVSASPPASTPRRRDAPQLPDRRSVQPRPERRGREPESRRRQTDTQRRRCHREPQRRLEDDRLSVDPHGHTGAGVDLELLRGPLRSTRRTSGSDRGHRAQRARQPAARRLSGSLRRRAGRSQGAVASRRRRGDRGHTGCSRRGAAGPNAARCRLPRESEDRMASREARAARAAFSATVFSLSSRYASDWTISA